MTEILVDAGLAASQQQFEQRGHVFVSDAYDPDMAPAILDDLTEVFKYTKLYIPVLGEQQGSVESRGDYLQYPALRTMLASIGHKSLQLTGCEVWPTPYPNKVRLTLIKMQPGTQGRHHTDEPGLIDTVTITTPKGNSELAIDGMEYKIGPGNAVLLDTKRRLPHHVRAVGPHKRIGLGIARPTRR